MKIRTAKYVIREGFVNAYKNKLMTLASVGIVIASLIIFGLFYVLTVNLNNIVHGVEGLLEVKIYCKPEVSQEQIDILEDSIKENNKVKEYKILSKKEAFDQLSEMLTDGNKNYNDKDAVLSGYDESFMPVTFVLKLNDPRDSKLIADVYLGLNVVEDVKYRQSLVDFILNLSKWIRIISFMLMIILLVISIFIISNTIRLTVFARRREINIMKYIGATDWFIRWPFVCEGVIIGIIGAISSFAMVGLVYNPIQKWLNNDVFQVTAAKGVSVVKMMEFKEMGLSIALLFTVIGIIVGASGSVISIRKHLHV